MGTHMWLAYLLVQGLASNWCCIESEEPKWPLPWAVLVLEEAGMQPLHPPSAHPPRCERLAVLVPYCYLSDWMGQNLPSSVPMVPAMQHLNLSCWMSRIMPAFFLDSPCIHEALPILPPCPSFSPLDDRCVLPHRPRSLLSPT